MHLPDNPYVPTGSVGGTAVFVGREALLADLERAVRQPARSPVLLAGGRLSGKTSVLDALAGRLRGAPDVVAVRFDPEPREEQPLAATARDLIDAIAAAMELTAPEVDREPVAFFLQRFLPMVLRRLPQGGCVALLLDEYDVVQEPGADHTAAALLPFLAQCRAVHPSGLALVLATGRSDGVDEPILAHGFPEAARKGLPLLDRRDVRDLIRISEGRHGTIWEPQAVEEVWWEARGHPALTQMLLAATWTTAWRGGSGPSDGVTITPDTVRAAAVRALEEGEAAFGWLWRGLSPAARVVAAALAEQAPPSVPRRDLAELLHHAGVRVVTPELEEAPRVLGAAGLFEPHPDPLEWRLPLLARWVRRTWPVSRVQVELDRLRPDAAAVYARAVSRRARGRLDDAKADLEHALELNPNHVGAMEQLIEVQLASEAVEPALRRLERLHALQPARSHDRLVNLLLERVADEPDLPRRADQLQRLLAVAPGHREATALTRAALLQLDAEGPDRPPTTEADLPAAPSRRDAEVARARDAIAQLEGAGRVHEALEVAERVTGEFDATELATALQRLRDKVSVAEHLDHGRDALSRGDRPTARLHLARVLAARPDDLEVRQLLARALDVAGDIAIEQPLPPRREEARWGTPVLLAAVALLALGGVVGWQQGWLAASPRAPSEAPQASPAALSTLPAAASAAPAAPDAAPDPPPAAPEPPAEAAAPPAPEAPAAPEARPAPPSASALVAQGWARLDAGDLTGAEGRFDRAARADPSHPGAQYGLGYVAEQIGRAELALDHYCRAMGSGRLQAETRREIEGRLRVMGQACP